MKTVLLKGFGYNILGQEVLTVDQMLMQQLCKLTACKKEYILLKRKLTESVNF
jgi:hypothetical protein